MSCEVKRRKHRLTLFFLFVLIVACVRLLSRRLRSPDEIPFQVVNNTTHTPYSSTFRHPHPTSTDVPIPSTRQAFESIRGDKNGYDFHLSDVDFRLELTYPTFTPRLPRFVDNVDRLTFLNDPVNLRYLRAPPTREVTGRVKVVRDAIVRIRRHECSWLTADDEFQSTSRQSLVYDDSRAHENSNSSTGFAFQCPLLVPDGHTFQHFVDGVLPKLVQLLTVIGHRSTAVQYILFRPRDRVIYEILETLGIAKNQLILVPPPLDHIEKTHEDDVIQSPVLIDTCVTPAVHPVLWRQARRLLVGTALEGRRSRVESRVRTNKQDHMVTKQSAGETTSASNNENRRLAGSSTSHRRVSFQQSNAPFPETGLPWSRSVVMQSDSTYEGEDPPSIAGQGSIVLLSRRWSRNRGRRLLNERAVFDELRAHFGPHRVVLYPDHLGDTTVRRSRRTSSLVGLSAARRLFSSANMVVGVHGGAFYNSVMAPVKCTVIEVMPTTVTYGNASRVPPGLAHTIVWRMAAALGHNYWRLYAATTSTYADVTLPVERLREVLKILDG